MPYPNITDKKAKKYFIYARKSSESEDRQVQSIEDQVSAMKELAQTLNLTVVDIITEAKSAKAPGARTGFASVLQRIDRNEAEGILTWKLDRLTRNPIDSATIQWMLQQGQIQSIRTPSQEYLPGDNAVIFSIETSMANQYIRELSKNVKRGLRSRFEKGWLPCRAPVGYLNVEVDNEAIIETDPERFSLMRRAWDEMLTGQYSVKQVLSLLHDEWGFENRLWRGGAQRMSLCGLYRIFTNPFYAGLLHYRGDIRQGKHKPMISLDEYDRVQTILGRDGRPRKKRHDYSYTGLIHCGECGGIVSAMSKDKWQVSSKSFKTHVYYYCLNAGKKRTPCTQTRYISLADLELQIRKYIAGLQLDEAILSPVIEEIKAHSQLENKQAMRVSDNHKKKIVRAEKKMTMLTKMRLDELIDDEGFKRERVLLETEIDQAKKKLNAVDTEVASIDQSLTQVLKFATHAKAAFDQATIQQRRSIISTMCSNLTLKDKKMAIQSHEWLSPVKFLRKLPTSEFQLFEPDEDGSVEPHNTHVEHPILFRCSKLNVIRTKLAELPQLPDIPDLEEWLNEAD